MPSPSTTLVAALVVATSVGFSAARHQPAPSAGDSLAAGAPAGRVAVVVLQPNDCESRLDALSVLLSEAQSAGVAVVVRVPGSAAARDQVLSRVLHFGWPLEVASLPPSGARALKGLGFAASPVVAVLDTKRRVHFVSDLPDTPERILQWHRLVPLVIRG